MLFPKTIKFNIKSYAKTVKLVHKIAIFLYSEFNGNRRPYSNTKKKINFEANKLQRQWLYVNSRMIICVILTNIPHHLPAAGDNAGYMKFQDALI